MACYQQLNMSYQFPNIYQPYGLVTPTSPDGPGYPPMMNTQHQHQHQQIAPFRHSMAPIPMQQPSPVQLPPDYILQYFSPPPSSNSPYSPSSPQQSFTQPSVGRAVVIGINYFNQKGEMKGRVDEARNLARYLEQVKKYRKEDMILLTDDQNGPYGQPTKRNILSAVLWLVKNAQPGEKLVLYYSGHGRVSAAGKNKNNSNNKKGSSDNKNKKTAAGNDDEGETMYPVDFRSFKEGMIKPQELQELLQPLNRTGARLTMILDTHAGIRS